MARVPAVELLVTHETGDKKSTRLTFDLGSGSVLTHETSWR